MDINKAVIKGSHWANWAKKERISRAKVILDNKVSQNGTDKSTVPQYHVPPGLKFMISARSQSMII